MEQETPLRNSTEALFISPGLHVDVVPNPAYHKLYLVAGYMPRLCLTACPFI